ncbi:MAG: LPS export ABC transporter permease LptG [Betaproteobacteria bacterium]|nr:LPS export ABC transporter permease LptG [Betaproteobacteria bacterium]MBI3937663.1 LPS export ABC transporter permease LptG [Betaproteobacteria bacterium]
MRVLRRYLASEIFGATMLVFVALVMLFAFLDLVKELGELGKGDYRLMHIVIYVLLSVPGHVYELFPIAALIGTLFALAQLVANSEYTVMRVSGVSMARLALTLVQVGSAFALVTFAFGEFIAPSSEQLAQRLRSRALSGVVAQEFRSGLWVKDELNFVNVTQVLPDSTLLGVKIYEFDRDHRLRAISDAKRGDYMKDNRWRLKEVVQTTFEGNKASARQLGDADWQSVLSPELLNVLLVVPEQMSAWYLHSYVQHLKENKQKATRYEIAFWSKLSYPLAVLVMMVLALPFAYLQGRSGGIGAKILAGIMLGLAFHMLNRLFAHLGFLNDWSPPASAIVPTLIFLGIAVVMMWWVERR